LSARITRLWILARIEVREWRRRKGNAAAQCHDGTAVTRSLYGLQSSESALSCAIRVGRPGVHHTEADAQHHLRSELVRGRQPRAERPRIVLREVAIAAARPIAFEDDGAR